MANDLPDGWGDGNPRREEEASGNFSTMTSSSCVPSLCTNGTTKDVEVYFAEVVGDFARAWLVVLIGE